MITNNFSKSNCPNFQNEYQIISKAKAKTKYKFSYCLFRKDLITVNPLLEVDL